MSPNEDVFEVGDDVIYTGFGMFVYGIVTEVKVQNSEEQDAEVRRYRVATNVGGLLTKISSHLQRAP